MKPKALDVIKTFHEVDTPTALEDNKAIFYNNPIKKLEYKSLPILAIVATTGQYLDLLGLPDLSKFGNANIYIQPESPTPPAPLPNSIWVDTDDFSRYDRTHLSVSATLTTSDNEYLTVTQTISITLHSANNPGIVKKIYNIGTGLVTIIGSVNGKTNMFLYPGESVELITDGFGWRY
jgi:hypothetical protein